MLQLKDVNIVVQGMEAFISSSKTDQSGRGHVVRIARGGDACELGKKINLRSEEKSIKHY